MALTTNPETEAVDTEYREALAEWRASKARLQAASHAHQFAHRMEEMARSDMAQRLRGLSDEEWAALRQTIDSPMPFNATVVPEPETATR